MHNSIWILYIKMAGVLLLTLMKGMVIISTGINGAVNDQMHVSTQIFIWLLLLGLFVLWSFIDVLSLVQIIKTENTKTISIWSWVAIGYNFITLITSISVYFTQYKTEYLVMLISSMALIVAYVYTVFKNIKEKNLFELK